MLVLRCQWAAFFLALCLPLSVYKSEATRTAAGNPKGISFGHSSTGISPPHGSHAALPIACDALNARTVAVREYHCPDCVLSPASCHACFAAPVFVARLFQGSHPVNPKQGLGAPAVWLGTVGMYPSALYCAGGLPLRAFFFKEHRTSLPDRWGKERE